MATSEGIPSSIDIEFLELNDNPYNRLKEYEAEAYSDYADDRSSYFSDSSQALADFRNVKETIRTAVSQALEYSSNIKQMVNSYANYDVAERLLICSLDYK